MNKGGKRAGEKGRILVEGSDRRSIRAVTDGVGHHSGGSGNLFFRIDTQSQTGPKASKDKSITTRSTLPRICLLFDRSSEKGGHRKAPPAGEPTAGGRSPNSPPKLDLVSSSSIMGALDFPFVPRPLIGQARPYRPLGRVASPAILIVARFRSAFAWARAHIYRGRAARSAGPVSHTHTGNEGG